MIRNKKTGTIKIFTQTHIEPALLMQNVLQTYINTPFMYVYRMDSTKTITNMMIFDKFKGGDSFTDAVIFAVFMSVISLITKKVNYYLIDNVDLTRIFNLERLLHIFSKKNVVTYEGKITCTTSIYDSELYQSAIFSDRFKAVWEHIVENVYENPQIYPSRNK